MRARVHDLTVAVMVSSCGGGDDGDGPADGSGYLGPTIVSTTPSDGAGAVGVLSNVVVVVSAALDAATVNDQTVRLHNEYGRPILGVVTWDEATLTITLNPTYALHHGRPHRLELDGLEDPEGRAVEAASVTFTTTHNPVVSSVSYADGNINGHLDSTNDLRGRMIHQLGYNGSGDDGTWLTQDDEVSSYTDQSFDDEAGAYTLRGVQDPGPDVIFMTDDDVVTAHAEGAINPMGDRTRVIVFGAGVDGILWSSDDVAFVYYDYVYNDAGQVVQYARYNDPGADGIWLNDDDPPATATDFTWDEGDLPLGEVTYGGPGDDGSWFTDDDLVVMYAEGFSTGAGTYRYVAYSWPFGPDATHGTDDDVPSSYTELTHTEDRQILTSWTYDGMGPDGAWFTSDDARDHGSTVEYDGDGNRTKTTSLFDDGPDLLWGTPDDRRMEDIHTAF